ncbi:MAG: hypothetical protein RLZZ387_3020 [Chloroflexota bacterium]
MLASINTWLNRVQIDDPVARRQAVLVQVMLLGLVVAVPLCVLLTLVVRAGSPYLGQMVLGMSLVAVSAGAALVLVRCGRFRAGVLTAAYGLLASLAILSLLTGLLHNPLVMIALLLPLAMAGLLLGRVSRITVGVLTIAVVAVVCALESLPTPLAGYAVNRGGAWGSTVIAFGILVALFGTFYDRFSATLRAALAESLGREQELERLRAGLEEAVAARTAELRASVDQLQASQATIRELGSPVLPVLPGVLVAPLIGAIDTARAADLSAAVLAAVDRVRARSVILDITGVPVVDTHVARALLQVAQAVRLLGAEAVLVGVSAEVAQTLVTLGVDLGAIHVHANLQEAVGALISTTIATAR